MKKPCNMLNYSSVLDLCETRRIKVKDLCSYIGLSYPGLKIGLDTQKMSADKIYSLCQCLNISPNYLFRWEDEISSWSSEITQVGMLNSQNFGVVGVDLLRQQLEEKDRQIAARDSQIEKLLNILNKD